MGQNTDKDHLLRFYKCNLKEINSYPLKTQKNVAHSIQNYSQYLDINADFFL